MRYSVSVQLSGDSESDQKSQGTPLVFAPSKTMNDPYVGLARRERVGMNVDDD